MILIVEFINLSNLQEFYNQEFEFRNIIMENNIRIKYRKTNDRNIIRLVRYDDTGKEIDVYSKSNFNNLNKIIEKYLKYIRVTPNNTRYNKLCGLPIHDKTSHCFNDRTHHTCCLLGHKARAYSNATGNPIGMVSEDMFERYFGRRPEQGDLTPWCTCIGSKVCSFYAERFNKSENDKDNDGTHIKFINKNGTIIKNLLTKSDCESKIVNENQAIFYNHATPGIEFNKKRSNNNCMIDMENDSFDLYD